MAPRQKLVKMNLEEERNVFIMSKGQLELC